MPTTNGNRKILDLKRWEWLSPAPAATAAGAFCAISRHYRQQVLYVVSATSAWLYNPSEDGWVALPSPALTPTIGAGSSGIGVGWSTGATVGAEFLTATGGTVSTLVTNQTLARDLRGYQVQILSGPNVGEIKTIARNTIAANATITFTAPSGSAFGATNTYRLLTPRWLVLASGTLAAGSFKQYDFATNTWTTLSQTGLAATLGTDGHFAGASGIDGGVMQSFATGTATGGTSTTLVNSAKTWTTNSWSNFQVRITGGTGVGQIRTIASNTGTTLTVGTAWTTTPDATSVYSIEGNDNFVYYAGNGAVTLYRYNIATNTWSTLAPGTARAAAAGTGMSFDWINGITATDWTDESNIQNGRYLYSWRGSASVACDRYDIALNAWSVVTPAPATETFQTGTKFAYYGDYYYIQKDATGRWFRHAIATQEMDGWNTNLYTQGAAAVGDTGFCYVYQDGATVIPYVAMILNTSNITMRQMVI
jgi:hypothetical protein